jgi:hypothetical protein
VWSTTILCLEGEDDQVVVGADGVTPILASAADEPYGTLDRLSTDSWSWGTAMEGQEKTPLFGRPNLFIAGVSYDHGRSKYKTSSELGSIGDKYVVDGSGTIVGGVVDPLDPDSRAMSWLRATSPPRTRTSVSISRTRSM